MNNVLKNAQLSAIDLLAEIDDILTENSIWYSLSYGSVLGAIREKGFIEWDRDIDIVIKKPDQDSVRKLLQNNLSSKYTLISCQSETVSSFDIIQINGISPAYMHVDLYPLIASPGNDDKAYRWQLYCRFIHKLFSCKYLDVSRLRKKRKILLIYFIRLIEYLVPDHLMRKYIDKLSYRYDSYESNYFFPFPNDGKRGEIMESELLFTTERTQFESLLLPVPKRSIEYLTRLYGNDFLIPKQY